MMLQKTGGCLGLRLSPFLLFLCPPDACNFYYLVSSFCNQVLIRSLNLGRAWFSLHHLLGRSTAVRDLQCEGSLEGPSASSQRRKRWFVQGGFPLPVPHECWCPNPSGALSSVSIAFSGIASEAARYLAEQNPLNPAASVWDSEQGLQTVPQSFLGDTFKCVIFLLQAGPARLVGLGSGGGGGAEGCGVAAAAAGGSRLGGWVGGAHQKSSAESRGCLPFQNKYINAVGSQPVQL